jgi:hypothetical protein
MPRSIKTTEIARYSDAHVIITLKEQYVSYPGQDTVRNLIVRERDRHKIQSDRVAVLVKRNTADHAFCDAIAKRLKNAPK